MSKVEDKIPGFKKKFGQNKNLVAEAIRIKMASKAASKWVAVESLLIYLKGTEVDSRKGAVEKIIECRKRTD